MPIPDSTPAPLLFRCDLHRRALPGGSTRTVLLLALVWLALPGAGFFIAGAWPVMGFLGLEFLLLGGALWVYRRRAARIDTLQITERDFILRRTTADGRTLAEVHLPPNWVQVENVEPEKSPRGGQGHILIRSHGAEYRIGDYLTFDERENLARDLAEALARTRV